MFPGYAGKIVRVDLTRKQVKTKETSEELARKFVGGRGLAAKIFFDEVPVETPPLSPSNLLIFMTGPYAGTAALNSGRHCVTCKSPLTGLYAHSDVGGKWGQELKFSGHDGIVLSGKAGKPVYIWIQDDDVEVRSARHLWGLDAYETDEAVKKETDEKAEVACIGPAGEKLVKVASILHDGKHARMAARAGVGAVMGSKNVKAIAVKGSKPVRVADSEKLQSSVKETAPVIVNNTSRMAKYGTSNIVESAEVSGDLPMKNWYQGRWEEGAKKISGERMAEKILVNRYFCGRCVIGCGRVVKITTGKYAGVDGSGPEYETVASLGSLCLVDNLEAIAMANEVCNRYGIDTISTGAAIAFAMEAYEKGLISKKDTGGIEMKWGSEEALLALTRMIGARKGIGKLLGQGVRAAAKKIGRNSEEFAVHIKGLELPMHDPRTYTSLAVAYATSNRGACHLEGVTHPLERNTPFPEFGYETVMNPYAPEGKGEMTAKMQNLMCMFDSLPTCKFLIFGKIKIQNLVDWLNAITGWSLTKEEFLKIGERIFNLERLYNVQLGISRKDDVIPPRILTNKRLDRGEATSLPHIGKMLSDYYQYRGWTEEGIPTKGKLDELGLSGEKQIWKAQY